MEKTISLFFPKEKIRVRIRIRVSCILFYFYLNILFSIICLNSIIIFPTAFFLKKTNYRKLVQFFVWGTSFLKSFLEIVLTSNFLLERLFMHQRLHFWLTWNSFCLFFIFPTFFFYKCHWIDIFFLIHHLEMMRLGRKMMIIVDSSEMCVSVIITFRYNQKRVNT